MIRTFVWLLRSFSVSKFANNLMDFRLEKYINRSLIELLKNTTLGTNGAKYKHLDIEKRIHLVDNPLHFTLTKNQKILGNITFCNREKGIYLRYFAFDNRFQGTGKKRSKASKSLLKNKIELLFEQLELDENKSFYAYIDPKNTRSKWLSEQFRFQSQGKLITQTFSRFYPKASKQLQVIDNFNEIAALVRKQYGNHHYYFEKQSSLPEFLALKNENEELLAFAKFTKVNWEICRLPGKFGGILTKLIPFIPLLNKLIRPKLHSFIVPEIVSLLDEKPEHLQELFSSALAYYSVNSLVWWVDINDSIYQKNFKKINWGLLDKLVGRSEVEIVVRGKLTKSNVPFFVSAFDMI